MPVSNISRRTVLKAGRGLLAASATLPFAGALQAQEAIQHSAGTNLPAYKLPLNACDCHMHFYHSRYPLTANVIRRSDDATVEEYRKLQKRTGSTRTVVVTPSAYGTDNSASLDGMAELGAANARGVAVVIPSVTDEELKRLHGLGIRGIRFNLATPGTTTIEMVEPLARRVGPLGWHVQMHMTADQIVAAEAMWPRLALPIVFDHMGRIPKAAGVNHPAFKILAAGVTGGRMLIKISGAYMDTTSGAPTYADSVVLAKAFVAAAPERILWGSDWPHPTEAADKKPNDATLVDLLPQIAPDAAVLTQILVSNPAKLYDFPKAG
jgi:D-galactarolactone isomerase